MPAPDPKRVEKLEQEIAALRKEMAAMMDHKELRAFIDQARVDLHDLRNGIDQVNGHVADALAELGTVPDRNFRDPDRQSVSRRLHKLEGDAAAAKIAAAALKAANEAKAESWSVWQKGALFLFAIIGTLIGVLNYLGIG